MAFSGCANVRQWRFRFLITGFPLPDGLRGYEADKGGNLVHGFNEAHSLQTFDQLEHVALVVAERIEPAHAFMNDNDDLSVAAIFHRPAGAFLEIERKPLLLQHRVAGHFPSQVFQICFFHSSRLHFLRSFYPIPAPDSFGANTGGREEQGGQGRAGQPGILEGSAGSGPQRRSFPCPPPRASGTGRIYPLRRFSSATIARSVAMSISTRGERRAISAATLAQW